MESNNNEIIDRLKVNVISKLDELDPGKKHDSTLIDYILVMVINQKNKFEMKHNLSLFLGKIVEDFVNWLFDFLAQLKMNVNETNTTNNNNTEQPIQEPISKQEPEASGESKNIETVKTEPKSEKSEKKVLPKRKLRSAVSTVSNESLEVSKSNEEPRPMKESGRSRKRSLIDQDTDVISPKKRSVLESHKGDSKRNFVEAKSHDQKDYSKKPNIKHETKNEIDDIAKENETKFLVTLDGVKDMFKEDLFLLDEDFDPELMREDMGNNAANQLIKNDASIKENNNANKLTERCKYWPSCMNGPKCEFFHPVTKCNTFPYCRFGDKCLYIHPTCKYDSFCSRKDCPFVHNAKRGQVNPPPNMTCKYFPNCMKLSCEFYHPKVCHFGGACKSFNCPYAHLPAQNVSNSKFKWSSEKNSTLSQNNIKEEIEIK